MPGFKSNRFALKNIRAYSLLLIAGLVTLSCSYLFSSGLPEDQPADLPPSPATSPTPQPPTPTGEGAADAAETLAEWPLVPGNTWTYRVEAYSEDLAATYIVTDTVVAGNSQAGVYLAQVDRQEEFTAGDRAVSLVWFEEPVRWYVVMGNRVFKPQSNAFAEIEKSWLEYVFPLSENCWHPSYESRAQPGGLDCSKFGTQAGEVTVAAGTFTNCDQVIEQYLSGGVLTSFCSGIGIVEEVYNHMGSPFGYHAQLIAYKVSSP